MRVEGVRLGALRDHRSVCASHNGDGTVRPSESSGGFMRSRRATAARHHLRPPAAASDRREGGSVETRNAERAIASERRQKTAEGCLPKRSVSDGLPGAVFLFFIIIKFVFFLKKIQIFFKKNPKIQNFDPLIFEPPNYEYSDSTCSRAPVYQIWGP